MSRWRDKKILAGLANAPLEALVLPPSAVDDEPREEEPIANVRYLGSYDVVNENTIMVPGMYIPRTTIQSIRLTDCFKVRPASGGHLLQSRSWSSPTRAP